MSSKRGGRGGGGGVGRRELPREVQVSKKLSWLLRHGAQSEGLKLGEAGYVSVADVLQSRSIKPLQVTLDEIKAVVNDNDKQRFSLIPSTSAAASSASAATAATRLNVETKEHDPSDPYSWLIRANQGHSIKVDTDGLLTPITTEDVPEIVVHGTTHIAWQLILKSGGMRRMGRNHMHFAQGLPKGAKSVEPTANEDQKTMETEGDSKSIPEPKAKAPVISGMRNTSTIVIYVDIMKALEAGIKFWKSDNGVILTEGDEKGFLGYQFFKRVEERQGGGKVLMRDGILPEGVEVDPNAADDELTIGRGKGKKRGGGSGGARGGKGRGKAPLVDDSRDVWAGV